ncbi:MAG: hypothetical protein RIS25_469 [Actinomycetota bacterium]
MTDVAAERFAHFHSRREQMATEPFGNLALVLTQWVDSEQTVWGVPGTWSPTADRSAGLQLTAAAADGIRVDGELIDGTTVVRPKGAESGTTISFSDTVQGTVIVDTEGLSALRVWDSHSEWIDNFGGISAFDYDPSLVITAQWVPAEAGTTLAVDKVKSGAASATEEIPGHIRFTMDGHDVELVAFSTGRALQIVFADQTNGVDTYSVGRFLFVVPNPDGTITLDFNLAVLPPCAFSYNFNCPIPPKQNRLPFRIAAGEQNVLAADGSLLHG